MDKYTNEDLEEALGVVCSTISKCEKIHPKFAEGTSQHTLLKNRIKALYISKSLITNENKNKNNMNDIDNMDNMDGLNDINKYTKEDLIEALKPISSIISKCEKAQLKFAEGTSHYSRFKNIINAMYISKSFMTDEISKRG